MVESRSKQPPHLRWPYRADQMSYRLVYRKTRNDEKLGHLSFSLLQHTVQHWTCTSKCPYIYIYTNILSRIQWLSTWSKGNQNIASLPKMDGFNLYVLYAVDLGSCYCIVELNITRSDSNNPLYDLISVLYQHIQVKVFSVHLIERMPFPWVFVLCMGPSMEAVDPLPFIWSKWAASTAYIKCYQYRLLQPEILCLGYSDL